MYAEVFAGFGVFAFILFYLAEISNKKPVGIIASFLVLLFGIWLLSDGTIYLRTGEVTTLAHVLGTSMDFNTTLTGTANNSIANYSFTTGYETGLRSEAGTIAGTETVAYTYTALSFTSLPIPIGQALAFIFIALGVYLFAAYSVDTFTAPTK